MYLVCITTKTTSLDPSPHEASLPAHHTWIGDGLSNVPFSDPDMAAAVMRRMLAHEWKEAERVANVDPSWIDTQEDEFTYTDHFGRNVVTGSIYSLDVE